MKKFLLMWVLMMAVVGICYGADNVTFEPDRTVRLGETFNVTVEVNNATNVSWIEIDLIYNTSILELIDITLIDNGTTASIQEIDIEDSEILLMWSSNNNPNGTFNLTNITFKAIGVGVVNITGIIRMSENGTLSAPTVIPATINVIAPDLTITNISVAPVPPFNQIYDQINVTVNVTITNNGTANATANFTVRLYENNLLIGQETVEGLNANEIRNVSLNWAPTSTGQITLRAVVDADNNITESNENNNIMERTVTVMPQPYIAINISPSTQEAYLRDTFTVNITLENTDNNRSIREIHGELTYDPRIITCIGINFSSDINSTDNNIDSDIETTEGRLIINITNQNISVSDIIIAQVTFKVLDNGTSDIELENITIRDTDGNPFSKIIPGSATVTVEPKIRLERGWNAISVPYVATLSSPTSLIVIYYDEGWKFVDETAENGCYKYPVYPLYGYYIYCSNDTCIINVTFEIGEYEMPTIRDVKHGWNLVGVNPAPQDRGGVRLEDFVGSVPSCKYIFRIDIPTLYDAENDEDAILYPYEAYWMFCRWDDKLSGRGWMYKYINNSE